jgi:hypothetical protein
VSFPSQIEILYATIALGSASWQGGKEKYFEDG